jgi:hypothetical protein
VSELHFVYLPQSLKLFSSEAFFYVALVLSSSTFHSTSQPFQQFKASLSQPSHVVVVVVLVHVDKLHAHPSFLPLTATTRKTENTEEEEDEEEGEGEQGACSFLLPSLRIQLPASPTYLPTLTPHPAFLPACLALLPSYLPPTYLPCLPTHNSTYLAASPFFLPTYLVFLPTFSTYLSASPSYVPFTPTCLPAYLPPFFSYLLSVPTKNLRQLSG